MSEQAHAAILAEWLPRLGQDASRLQRYELLQGGVSGALVYRLHGLDHPCVLKLATAESAAYVRARGQREIAFYHALADAVPVALPRVLADAIEPSVGASAVLLLAYDAPLDPQGWQVSHYLSCARELARLHATFWDATELFASAPWLRPRPITTPAELRAAERQWQQLWGQPRFQAIFSSARRAFLREQLSRMAAAQAIPAELPPTLCHNDFHMGNLLRAADGRLIWADWQEIGVGYGPEDLSFFLQRASAAGAHAPAELMLATYHEQLSVLTRRTISLAALQRHMHAYELQTLLVQWPGYLQQSAPAQLLAHVQRIEQLAALP